MGLSLAASLGTSLGNLEQHACQGQMASISGATVAEAVAEAMVVAGATVRAFSSKGKGG